MKPFPLRLPRPLVGLLALALLDGCSSTPPAAPAIAVGAASLEAARSAGAPEYAATELNDAMAKLERARSLARAGDSVAALRWAEQADVDAQLAHARAGSERSRRALLEVEAGLATLRTELGRSATTPDANSPAREPR